VVRDFSTDDLGIVRHQWNWGDGSPVLDLSGLDQTADQVHTYAQSGYFMITLTLTDTAGNTASLDLWATANTQPVAMADKATTERDVPVTVAVLTNDSDADGDELTIYGTTVDRPGTLAQIVPVGRSWAVYVTPPDSFVGALNLTYTIVDRWGGAATGAVIVNVTQWISITDAVGEQFYCPQNGIVRIAHGQILANDFDSEGDVLTIVSRDTSVLSGTLDCATETTACTYHAPANSAGSTIFRYTITDPAGHRDAATVRILVGVGGGAPAARDDYFTTPFDAPKTFTYQDATLNDSDPDGDVLAVTGLVSGARDYGSLSCSTPFYQCTYTPNAGFVGTDRLSYAATDMINDPSAATINILTLPPTAATFDAREDVFNTGLNQPLYMMKAGWAVNDYDPEQDPISVTAVESDGINGSLTCDSVGCNYVPVSNWSGVTRFTYTATDGRGSSDTAIVRVRVNAAGSAPVAAADTLSTHRNTVLRFSVYELLRNDYDPDNDPLTVTVQAGQKGTMSCGTPQYWCTYTPNAAVTGADVISYSVSDGTTATQSNLTINIVP
jgi:hypothetical protein